MWAGRGRGFSCGTQRTAVQPLRSMAEKPQIQLFIKVRGVLRSVPQATGSSGNQLWQCCGGVAGLPLSTAVPRCGALGRQGGR